jgi:hypothetical protein
MPLYCVGEQWLDDCWGWVSWCCGGHEDSRMALQKSGVQLVPSVTFWGESH